MCQLGQTELYFPESPSCTYLVRVIRMKNFCGNYKGRKCSSSHFVAHTHFHRTDGSSQWFDIMAGPTTTHLPLNFLSASYTSGPDVCIKFLLQDTYSIKVRGNQQDLTRPCGPNQYLQTPVYSCSPPLYIHLLFLNACLMNFQSP